MPSAWERFKSILLKKKMLPSDTDDCKEFTRSDTQSPIENTLRLLQYIEDGRMPLRDDVLFVKNQLLETSNIHSPPIYYDHDAFGNAFKTAPVYPDFSVKYRKSFSREKTAFIDNIVNAIPDDLVETWQFDIRSFCRATKNRPLSSLSMYLFYREGLITFFDIDPEVLYKFLLRIEHGYLDVPFHNIKHATCVLQGMHMLLKYSEIIIDATIHLACYLSAIIHDFEHKGVTNTFLIETEDEIALTHNDISPLEHHHVSAAFKILRQKEFHFLKHLSKAKMERIRSIVVDLVLATDMNNHFDILSKFRSTFEFSQGNVSCSSSTSPTHSDILTSSGDDEQVHEIFNFYVRKKEIDNKLLYSLQMMMKCADLSHFWHDEKNYWDSVYQLEEEFFRQGDLEKMLNTKRITPYFDRDKEGISTKQYEFIKTFVRPLFKNICKVYPKMKYIEKQCIHLQDLTTSPAAHHGSEHNDEFEENNGLDCTKAH